MKDIFVIFPIDLYNDVSYIKGKKVFLVEEQLYFDRSSKKLGNMKFNILKPIYHRATMKAYYDKLKSKNIDCTYIDLTKNWINIVKKNLTKNRELYFFDPVDVTLENKLKNSFDEYTILNTPRFILSTEEMIEYDKPLKQTSFYIWMRKYTRILMNKNNKPEGGKISFDTENRKSPTKNMQSTLTKESDYNNNKYIKEALSYVKKNISENNLMIWNNVKYKNLSKLSDAELKIKFPIESNESKKRLNLFIKKHLAKFGTYQDVMLDNSDNSFIHHSGISPMLNIGLLTPEDVIIAIIDQYRKMNTPAKKKNMNNIEGFIRQILGWREFSRYMYQHHRSKYLNKNFFNAKSKIGKSWYDGTTNIYPIDLCINKAFKYGYLHHIERLMIIANYMTLTGISPKQMYKWFTEFALDSYDWVMEYNVFVMGSYSDGGHFTTKPYISSSNYIFKMSDFKKDETGWNEKWDTLFWQFMKKHKKKIKKIPRLGMLLKHV